MRKSVMYFKIQKEMIDLDEQKVKEMTIAEIIANKINLLKKGIGLSATRILIGYNNDDFALNLVTINIISWATKIPRYIAAHRLKQINREG